MWAHVKSVPLKPLKEVGRRVVRIRFPLNFAWMTAEVSDLFRNVFVGVIFRERRKTNRASRSIRRMGTRDQRQNFNFVSIKHSRATFAIEPKSYLI
jgi:hypothetical protein